MSRSVDDPVPIPDDADGAVFRAHGLTKVYRMGEVEVHALRGVDLTLERGEFAVLLGIGEGAAELRKRIR